MDLIIGLPERPAPLEHLTEAEAAVWQEVVATKPADWFMRDSQPILAAYCQAVVMHRDLMARWHAVSLLVEPKEFKTLVDLIHKSANLAAQLATKLRLTQQARYTPGSASTASKKGNGNKLWQKS